jgi:hypothetical protein
MNKAGASRLIFNWDQFRRIPFVLLGFILISAAAHLCPFFLFQVVYPPQASIKAPHPSFSVIDPRRPDHQALLRWIDAEDPAPAATGGSNITDRLLNVTYQPSFATMRTSPLAVPETPPTVLFPPARDPLAIIRSVEPKPAPLPPPEVAKLTRVAFSSTLAGRVPDTLPPFTVATKASEPVDSAEFLIGVSDRGEIRFIFPQRSSANPNVVPEAAALDAEAADRLALMKLKPGLTELTWGWARIDWGAEIYRASAPPKNPGGTKTRP